MFTMSIMSAIQDSLRTLMLDICSIIYRLIAFCFEVFYNLGTANLLKEDAVQKIISRFSLIIGIFMVFRVTFAFIQYIIDPDTMTDKNKGAANIVKKIIIAIVLLGSTSFLFKFAFTAQEKILQSHVLEKVILSRDDVDSSNFGTTLSATLFTTFYRIKSNPSDSEDKNYRDCKDLVDNYLEEDIINNKGSLDLAYSCLLKRTDYPAENNLVDELSEEESEKSYIVDFDGGGLLAVIVGVIVLYIGFMFTLQVGVRLLQLVYLQIIAPIPIAMYITPKGDDNLKKWGQQCATTFLDFFLRVAILYFAIAIIEIIRDNNSIVSIYTEGTIYNLYVTCIMIIATLLFVKKIPALLKEIFPSLGGAAGFSYDISKKAFKETMKLGYDATPIGWGLKGAKSLGSAIDRKVHGKPFFGRGKLGQAIDKWLPEQAEVRKQKEEAQAAARHREDMLKQGEELFNNYNGDSDALIGAFSSGEYKNSYLALRKAKKDTGNAELELSAAQADLNAAHASGNKEAIRIAKDRLQVATDNLHAMQGNLELAKARHDSNKKIFKKDAAKEDAFKYWKDTHSDIKNYSENMPDLSGQSQQEQINQTLQEILQNQQGTGNESVPNTNNSNIIIEEHVQSRPRQETTSTSVQDEYSRLVSQYNGETDPSKKAELRRQIEEFERRH